MRVVRLTNTDALAHDHSCSLRRRSSLFACRLGRRRPSSGDCPGDVISGYQAILREANDEHAILRTIAAIVIAGGLAKGQAPTTPVNSLPNPYQTIKDWARLPDGRTWGSTSAVDIDKDGKSLWVAERCGQNSCLDRATGQMSPLAPILKFDSSGRLVTSFGAGLLIVPHGIFSD